MERESDFGPFSLALAGLGVTMLTEVSPPIVAVYWDALCDLPARAMVAAIERAKRESEAFPKPIELRRHARAFLSDEQNRRGGENATRCLPFRQYAYLLAQLADPEVPEAKKTRIKEQWSAKNPGVPGPWEGDANQW